MANGHTLSRFSFFFFDSAQKKNKIRRLLLICRFQRENRSTFQFRVHFCSISRTLLASVLGNLATFNATLLYPIGRCNTIRFEYIENNWTAAAAPESPIIYNNNYFRQVQTSQTMYILHNGRPSREVAGQKENLITLAPKS